MGNENFNEAGKPALQQGAVSGSVLFTKEQVYRIVANFALSVNTEAFCGGYGTTTEIAEELKKFDYVDFSGEEKSH